MKKFVFSMQKILDLRNFELDQAEAELGKVNAEIARVNNGLKEIAYEHVKYSHYADESRDFSIHSQTQAYFVLLEQKKEAYLAELAQLEAIAEEKRAIVRECMQKVKVLDKLKERKLQAWKDENQKKEEMSTDDVVTAQSYRKAQSEQAVG